MARRSKLFSKLEALDLGLLQGWKAIGCYLGCSARTVRRWHDNGCLMIIHRNHMGRPFAFSWQLAMYMEKLAELVEKNKEHKEHKDYWEKRRQHAAMMRDCKRKKREGRE